ncbi:MAG: hypothetical protein ACI3VB_06850 [Oscillospiraceae bacterium]
MKDITCTASFPRFGVSGVGGRSAALTRLWDSVGMSALPGTDTIPAKSDFDAYAPFNRKKCVGTWSMAEDGSRATFKAAAYYGDPGYTEDGSLGNYVAIDVEPLYWYHDDASGILGVSAGQVSEEWMPHPICLDLEGNIREHTYIPAYELALDKDGLPVSLPGFQPRFGTYYGLREDARNYLGGILSDYASLETTALWHYNYLLMTIEFATQNMQDIMYGASSMRFKDDLCLSVPEKNKVVVSAEAGDTFVLGQTIFVCGHFKDHPADTGAYNILTNIERCDANGTVDPEGDYRLLTYDGADRSADITAGVTQIASRPWITGVCTGASPYVHGVLGHTGSPVSNSNGIYPMMYRWMENFYSNINKQCVDIMNAKRGTDDSNYYLEWYYLPDPTKYMPAGDEYPDVSDLENHWVKLCMRTEHENYVNGFIKKFETDPRFPHVSIPTETAGADGETYYCDWADVVLTHAVRSIRRGGSMYSFDHYGPCFMSCNGATDHGGWYYGGRLFMIQ